MHVFKARVVDGRLKLDEPTDLPDGMVLELVPANPEAEMSPEELASIDAGIADMKAGRVVDSTEVHRRLRALRER
jgi:hypothetical protein